MTLLASYSFDEAGSTVTDLVGGYSFDLTGTGITRVSGYSGNGCLAGTSPALIDPSLCRLATNRTIIARLKGVAPTAGWPIIWNITSIDSGCWGFLFLNGKINIQVRNVSTLNRAVQSTNWEPTQWHHVAGTYDGSEINLYVDGVLDATAALTGPIRTDNDQLEFMVTSNGITIDNLKIYDSILDLAAIQADMNGGGNSGGAEMGSVADLARTNMLTDRHLVEPQLLSNTDLMALVLADGLQTLVTKTNASIATHLVRYEMSLG